MNPEQFGDNPKNEKATIKYITETSPEYLRYETISYIENEAFGENHLRLFESDLKDKEREKGRTLSDDERAKILEENMKYPKHYILWKIQQADNGGDFKKVYEASLKFFEESIQDEEIKREFLPILGLTPEDTISPDQIADLFKKDLKLIPSELFKKMLERHAIIFKEKAEKVEPPRAKAVVYHPPGQGSQPVGESHDVADDPQAQVAKRKFFLKKKEHGRKDQQVPMAERMGAPGEGNDHLFITVHKKNRSKVQGARYKERGSRTEDKINKICFFSFLSPYPSFLFFSPCLFSFI